MRMSERLQTATRLFLDTASVIYFVEKHPHFADLVRVAFDRLDEGSLSAVTSPVTLSECLVLPYRIGRPDAAQAFIDVIVYGDNVTFAPIDQAAAERAAELRTRYNMSLPDAFQAAVAMAAGCDAFLTNDATFKRVAEINVIVLGEMEPG